VKIPLKGTDRHSPPGFGVSVAGLEPGRENKPAGALLV